MKFCNTCGNSYEVYLDQEHKCDVLNNKPKKQKQEKAEEEKEKCCCDYKRNGVCKYQGKHNICSYQPKAEAGKITCLSSDCPERTGGKCNVLERMKAETEWEERLKEFGGATLTHENCLISYDNIKKQ